MHFSKHRGLDAALLMQGKRGERKYCGFTNKHSIQLGVHKRCWEGEEKVMWVWVSPRLQDCIHNHEWSQPQFLIFTQDLDALSNALRRHFTHLFKGSSSLEWVKPLRVCESVLWGHTSRLILWPYNKKMWYVQKPCNRADRNRDSHGSRM